MNCRYRKFSLTIIYWVLQNERKCNPIIDESNWLDFKGY
jgi:hypothetical protein